MARARTLQTRSTGLVARSQGAVVAARRARDRAAEFRRMRHIRGDDACFVVRGFVDDLPVVARWGRRGGLECTAELRQRAEIVVDLGETFGEDDGANPIPASLGAGPTAALLTVVRAMNRVTSIDVHADRMESGAPGHG